jgi:hypothetical protein
MELTVPECHVPERPAGGAPRAEVDPLAKPVSATALLGLLQQLT